MRIIERTASRDTTLPRVRESGFRNRQNFACGIRNRKKILLMECAFWVLQSRIQLKESRILVPLTKTEIQYLESGIHGVESSPRLHWIPLRGATTRAAYGAKRETCDEAKAVNLCDKKSPTYTHASPEAKWNWCIRVRAILFRVQPTFRFKFMRIWENFIWMSRQIIGVPNRGLKQVSHQSWIES